jgi:cell division protease FtsH
LNDRLAVLLGGRAAEEVIFGEMSSGASNDLERASDMARQMVTQLGMSEKVGPVTYGRRRATFLQSQEPADGRDFRRILVESYQRALEILRRDRDFLEAIARRLLDKEVMDRSELRELLGLPPDEHHGPEVGHVGDHAAD